MGMYGRAAVTASRMLQDGVLSNPETAWKRAVARETTSSESRRKSCPRGAFLELCAVGVIPGCAGRSALLRSSNGEYAVQLLEALRKDEHLLTDTGKLWEVAAGKGKRENGQVDIVVALWGEGLIE
jgi:uncharacterized protein DUF6979